MNLTRRELLAAGVALGATPLDSLRSLGAEPVDSLRRLGAQPQAGTRSIADFFREFTDDWVRHDPSLATANRYFMGSEQDALERQVTPRTVEWRRDRISRARKGLVDLGRFDRGGLSDVLRISADLLQWQLAAIVDSEPFLDFTFALEQMNGANVTLVDAFTIRRTLVTERDAENYVATLPRSRCAWTNRRRTLGAWRTGRSCRRGSSSPPPSTRCGRSRTCARRRTRSSRPSPSAWRPSGLSRRHGGASSRPTRSRIVAAQVYPAWKRAIELLESQTAGATDDAGLWRLPGGLDAYAYFLRYYTTDARTANDIHEIGLMQVSRIETEMDRLLRQIGRTDGSVKDRIARLKLDLQYPNPRSEQSREQIMRDIDGIIRDAERRAALLFDRRPASPVVARPFPAFREANAAANYNAPAPDGSRPGRFNSRGAWR
jgi:uncharacterized protein (DUF885 family)